MSQHNFVRMCATCIVLLCGSVQAQEYYGVPIEGGGVAFLLDVSGSMAERTPPLTLRGPASAVKGDEAWRSRSADGTLRHAVVPLATPQVSKMDAARRELLHALSSLRDGTNFTIITFGTRAAEWPGGIQTMRRASIGLAREFVVRMSAGGGTAMAEALRLGFQAPNVRTLFVVSDGRPTTGDVLALVRQLQASRQGRRMVINTIGIGQDQDSALLCQLARENEGVYVRDREVACTFSPCSPNDGLMTFYPPEAIQTPHLTRICSSATHPDCTAKLVYDTMISEAQLQIVTRDRTKVTDCIELDDPYPATVVVHDDGLEATNYTRPGHPSHPGKIMRIVKQQGDDIVVETTGAGNLRPTDYEAVDLLLIDAVLKKLAPKTEEVDASAQTPALQAPPKKPTVEALPKKKVEPRPKGKKP